ncbi:efflux RND transporter periplasmic adaptor subunit [Tautonia rosea]|uniref:efflux RND transporter periplasmic adaptor subunit n=1 Tax=Tautonia rosea TaxID=2728037 RepID=UPI00147651B0|nr:efflux RND transporter periplasmic adaptor subunit [Tautonia rosea]
MKTRTSKRGLSWLAAMLVMAGMAASAAVLLPSASWSSDARAIPEGITRVPVVRQDLSVTVVASGELNSSENTLIECELEEMSERNAGGSRISTSGRSVIIDLIPEGSVVKKGDILCQIDGSEYEEMIRQKEIEVQKSAAQLEQVELDLQTAQISLTEYIDGLRIQQIQEYEGQVKLAEAQFKRQQDRLAWSEKMLPLGYISQSRYEQEKQLFLSDQIALDRVRLAYANYLKYTVPKMTQSLETQVDQRLSTAIYYRRRHERQLERLETYKEQLANCTIRAPHDGYVIYATDRRRDVPLAPGVEVRENMDLFYLPNLNSMQVEVTLNETIVERVRKDMPATVRITAFPEMILPGRVIKVERLPVTNRMSFFKDDVKDYRAIIETVSMPGLMPKMEAEVEIETDRRVDALVVPSEALAFEKGNSFCYVASDGGLECRRVEVRPGTIDMLQITGGLDEGEEVVLNPTQYDLEDLVIKTPAPQPLVTADPIEVGESHAALGSVSLY